MKNKYFGTDGIRGRVNQGNITGEKFFKFGLASGTYFKNQKKSKQIAIIAKDTRLSGYTLEPALVSGLVSGGMHVYTLGPLPTNGLAMLTKSMKANMGIMITASHNPYFDNGLKLFGPDGMKLSDKIEKKIEKLIDAKNTKQLTNPKLLGRVKRLEDGNDKYTKILKNNFPSNFHLKGTKIVLDCANGASYKAAPKLLKELGAKVISIGVKPNGLNINDKCGSTYPSKIKTAVKKHKAKIGIAFDGDADRVIMCDEKGKIIDGDQIIAMLARRWKSKKILKGGVIGTLMSNYGLEKFLLNEKIRFSKKLGVKTEEVVNMNRRMMGQEKSLNDPIKDGEKGEWQDWIVSDDLDQELFVSQKQEMDEKKSLLQQSIKILNNREREILEERKLSSEPKTLEELSKKYKISRERIRQIETKAFEKLQKAMLNATQSKNLLPRN